MLLLRQLLGKQNPISDGWERESYQGEQCLKRRCCSCRRFGTVVVGRGWDNPNFCASEQSMGCLDEIGDVTCHKTPCQDMSGCFRMFSVVKISAPRNHPKIEPGEMLAWQRRKDSTPPLLPGQTSRDQLGAPPGATRMTGSDLNNVDLTDLFLLNWVMANLQFGFRCINRTSSSLSLLFGNINRTGFSNTMILLGPWPKHFQFKNPSTEVQLKPRIGWP